MPTSGHQTDTARDLSAKVRIGVVLRSDNFHGAPPIASAIGQYREFSKEHSVGDGYVWFALTSDVAEDVDGIDDQRKAIHGHHRDHPVS